MLRGNGYDFYEIGCGDFNWGFSLLEDLEVFMFGKVGIRVCLFIFVRDRFDSEL